MDQERYTIKNLCIGMLNEDPVRKSNALMGQNTPENELVRQFLSKFRDMQSLFCPECLDVTNEEWKGRLKELAENYPPEYKELLEKMKRFAKEVYPRLNPKLSPLLNYRYIDGPETRTAQDCISQFSISKSTYHRQINKILQELAFYFFEQQKGEE